MNLKQKNDFLIDKIDINISSNYISRYCLNEDLIRRYSIKPNNPDRKFKRIIIKNVQGGGIIFSTTMSFNFNSKARKLLKDWYNIPRTATLVSNKENFIPILYKNKMEEDNFTYAELRTVLYDSFWRRINKYTEEFHSTILPLITKPNQQLAVYLSSSHISISQDLKFPHGIDFLESENVREKLNSVSSDCSPIIYTDDKSNTMIVTKSVRDMIDPKRKGLKGTIDNDKSVIICYLKEESKYGDQVRIENRLDRDVIRDKLGSTKFKSKEDFIRKVELLGCNWSELIYNTLQLKVNDRSNLQKKVLKKLCRQLFPRESHRVFKNIYFQPHTICTGKESISPSSVFRKVRLLAGDGKLFKKKSHTFYSVDYEWLSKYINGEVDL